MNTANQRRSGWLPTVDTDSIRLFHGAAEGVSGLTIDRYGSEILVGVFRSTFELEWESLAERIKDVYPSVTAVTVVRRGKGKQTLATVGQLANRIRCHEGNCVYWNSLVKAGNDPWFYLDFRSTRRFIATVSSGARVANFFSYTGTAGVVAAMAGADQVFNIDFGRWCIDIARDNFKLNALEGSMIRDDFFSVSRQWAGGQVKNRRRGNRGRRRRCHYPAKSFDLVILDPPTRSNGPFGAVDIIRDYPSLAKPCMQMLSSGGWLVCSHHHSAIDFDRWQAIIHRTAEKIGRSIVAERRILPDPDFPVVGSEPLLKVLALQLA